jgi:hypothetical protein
MIRTAGREQAPDGADGAPGERSGVPRFPQGQRASAQRVRVGSRMSRAR